ncbi:hypothetical protein RMCBS344292_01620 [Rhizopus microsporus]|nr:hypothetical protein RMCBS344292_01620 [Rhizopus microsporus]
MRLSFSILLLAASLASVQAASTNKASASCLVPGNRGMGTGEGWKDYCCENSDDCRESCIKGKCNGKANPKPPTDDGSNKCVNPKNRGTGTGKGWKDYCCEDSDDCRDTCIKGKCNDYNKCTIKISLLLLKRKAIIVSKAYSAMSAQRQT